MTRHAEARLFAALDLPFAIRAQLAGWARTAAASVRAGARASAETTHTQLTPAPGERETHARMRPRPPTARGQLRLLEPDTLHVTLCFLGNRPVGEIEALGGALAEACAEAPPVGSLALGAPLWLPPRHPRALAVELHDTPDHALAELQAAIAAALAAVCDLAHSSSSSSSSSSGSVAGKGRHRDFRPHITLARLRPADAPRERGLPPTPALSFLPSVVTLQRSWLAPAEATYEQLVACALAAAGAE